MSDAVVLDLVRLRRSCAECTLRELCLPAGIGAKDTAQLDRIVKRRRPIDPKQRLFSSGSASKALFVARTGSFKTVAYSDDGQEQVLGFHLPGELIGLDALGVGYHRCDAIALEPAGVCEVPLHALEGVAAQVPGLQHQLLRIIGRSTGLAMDHMEMLGRRQAMARVMLFLNGLAERYRLLGHPPQLIVLPMSREDIANHLGLVIETVSRSFTRLQKEGVIEVQGRQVSVLDPSHFENLAHAAGVALRKA